MVFPRGGSVIVADGHKDVKQALIDLVPMGMLLFIFPGAYRPDIHKQYGSNSALRMGGESDMESVISSDVSIFGHDHPQALR